MIIDIQELAAIRNRHKTQKLVLTSGTFDLFHVGHLSYLEAVKKYGEILIVLLSGDNRVKARKGQKRPIINQDDRARILDSLEVVDYVLVDPSLLSPDDVDPVHAEILKELQPDYYVTDGPDPRFYNLLDESKFVVLDRINAEPSTTSIIERILNVGSSEK